MLVDTDLNVGVEARIITVEVEGFFLKKYIWILMQRQEKKNKETITKVLFQNMRVIVRIS